MRKQVGGKDDQIVEVKLNTLNNLMKGRLEIVPDYI